MKGGEGGVPEKMDIDLDIRNPDGYPVPENTLKSGESIAIAPEGSAESADEISNHTLQTVQKMLDDVTSSTSGSESSTNPMAMDMDSITNTNCGPGSGSGHDHKLRTKKPHRCLNDACSNGKNPNYPKARKIALIYFGIGIENGNGTKKSKNHYICESCNQEVDEYLETYTNALKGNVAVYSLESLKIPNVTIDILDDSDEDGESSGDSSDEAIIEELDFDDIDKSGDVLDEVLVKMLADLNVKAQVELCHDYLNEELDSFEKYVKEQDDKLLKCEEQIEHIRKAFEDFVGPDHTPVILRTIDVADDGRVTQITYAQEKVVDVQTLPPHSGTISNRNQSPSRKPGPKSTGTGNKPKLNAKSYKPGPASVKAKLLEQTQQHNVQNSSQFVQAKVAPQRPGAGSSRDSSASTSSGYSTASIVSQNSDSNSGLGGDDDEVQLLTSGESGPVPALLPIKRQSEEFKLGDTPKVLPKMIPGKGRSVYIMRSDLLSYWVKAKVLDTYKGPGGSMEFKVQIDGIGNKKSQARISSGKFISFGVPTPFVLPVGARVIAKFNDEFNAEPFGNGQYYAGIIAEKPSSINNYRYLIFFDDGYAQYVHYKSVLWICECSREVYQDVHPLSQQFIKDYLKKYPERPMVRLTEGQVITTERKGEWWSARVIEVDGSLVKVYFTEAKKYEWIYRGSTRLSPMFNKEQRQKQALESPVGHSHRRRTYNLTREAKIEYNYQGEDSSQRANNTSIKNPHNTARKSTAAPPQPSIGYMLAPGKKFPKELAKNYKYGFQISTIEYDGKLMKDGIPEEILPPQKYIRHECGPKCVRPYDESKKEYRLVNPLQLPFYLGFSRETAKIPKRLVFYKSPCGKRLRDYDELYKYLRITEYNLGIDYFCFDFTIDVMNEFVPAKTHYTLDDCSFGKETTPVQCVNAIDSDFPEISRYSKDRQAGNGVNLNLDENFLACCDCEDDCADKSKCACWKLTIEGTKIVPALEYNFDDNGPGYQNKRLMDHVVSGIYECNSKCKCKSTCLNRVVQHDLKWQLQVFKTANKGWAIRPLHDIPNGSFICVYAGQILTDDGANEDGKAFGDEYLAELDFIEVMETVKENYEADAYGPGLDKGDPDYQVKQGNGNKSTHEVKNRHSTNQDGSPQKQETRRLFGKDEQCYIMDAKSVGNIGRYLNHSCTPNVFVQNVFVDTHDLRFPWVAFFAFKNIRAGTELTWDYNYEIGSVPGKIMYCYCGSPECRGRLL